MWVCHNHPELKRQSMEWKLTYSPVKKVPDTVVSLLVHERTHRYWFSWKGASVNRVPDCQFLQQNLSYLLNDPHIYIYATSIHIHTHIDGPVGWGSRTNRLHLRRRVRLPQKRPGYDTEQSDGEAPIMLELWRMQSTFFCHRSQVHSSLEW